MTFEREDPILSTFTRPPQFPTWGLYLCEYPTLLLIGCVPAWHERFAQVYGITGNGYAALASFIAQEYHGRPDLQAQLVRTYGFA